MNYKKLSRSLRRILGANRTPSPIPQLWRSQSRALATAIALVRIFYICLFFIVLQTYSNWSAWLRTTDLHLLWPVAWFRVTGSHAGLAAILFFAPASALLAAIRPDSRIARILAAVGILLFGGFFNSFGTINHGFHTWIWTAVIFTLLPDSDLTSLERSLIRRQRYLRIFWWAQAAILFFYTLSGSFKLTGAFVQLAHHQHNAFSFDALARHIAYRLQEGMLMDASLFGAKVIAHPIVGWPLLLTSIYLEFFSLLIAFRPAAHRLWGVLLILMHLGIYLTLAIMFSWQLFLVGILFLCSPFAPQSPSSCAAVRQLPLIGDLLTRRGRATRASTAIDNEYTFTSDEH